MITREVDYAVRCVLDVARNGRTSTGAVAERAGIPLSILGRIVAAVSKAGILETRRGVKGGIDLARDPSEISLLDVIEAVQGPLFVNICCEDPKACEAADDCVIRPVCEDAFDEITRVFSVTYDTLLNGGHVPLRVRSDDGK